MAAMPLIMAQMGGELLAMAAAVAPLEMVVPLELLVAKEVLV